MEKLEPKKEEKKELEVKEPEAAPKEQESGPKEQPAMLEPEQPPAKKVADPKRIEALKRINSLFTNHID